MGCEETIIQLGKKCAVDITGWIEDADDITTWEEALLAINECIRLGKESHNQLNQFLYDRV